MDTRESILAAERDLAVDRTALSNERTLLAYLRTALQAVVGGATLIRFFDHPVADVVGWLLLPCGVVLVVLGIRFFRRRRRQLAEVGGLGL